MSSIFKQQYTSKDKDGKTIRKRSEYWYIDYKTADGIRKRIKGFKDKTATVQLAAKLEREAELAQAGIVDKYAEHHKKPLADHLDEFKASLLNKGTTVKQTEQVYKRAKEVINNCGFIFVTEISASKVQSFLADLRREGLSIRTSNYYQQATKQFCRWLVADNRTAENPLAYLKGLNPKTDIRHKRRALTNEELDRLIKTTVTNTKHCNMTGKERAMLYILAANTGFRAGELASLTWQSFELDGPAPTVTILAAYSKRRRNDVQPLRLDVAEMFALWQEEQGVTPDSKVFSGFDETKGARMMRKDLKSANISYRDSSDHVVDFHALRHTFISNIVVGGASPKVAQQLARHSTISLTMDTYTHLQMHHEQAALEGLPSLPNLSGKEPDLAEVPILLKTGTDAQVTGKANAAYKPAYKKLAKNTYPEGHKVASVDNVDKEEMEGNRNIHQDNGDHKSLSMGKLGNDCHCELPTDTGERRGRDSNPRYRYMPVRRFSKPLP